MSGVDVSRRAARDVEELGEAARGEQTRRGARTVAASADDGERARRVEPFERVLFQLSERREALGLRILWIDQYSALRRTSRT